MSEETSDGRNGLTRLGQRGRELLVDVNHPFGDIQLDCDTRGARLLGQPNRIIEAGFPVPDLNQQWRQA